MATHSYSATLAHTTDADFRAWGKAASDAMTAVGFLKTGDTGQIDWLTVARPGAGVSGGYEIRLLNDSLHGTKPCHVKIEYGTNGSTATNPQMWITVGSGTNGARTITGTTYFARKTYGAGGGQGTPAAGSFFSYLCYREGYVMFCIQAGGVGSGTGPMALFALTRTEDNANAYTTEGFHFYENSPVQAIVRHTYIAAEVLDSKAFSFFPGSGTGPASTLVSGVAQIMRHFAFITPLIRVVPNFYSYIVSEIGGASTFTVTPIGAVSRTYIALGINGTTTQASLNVNSNHRLAVRYE